jgi:hypothetical protein
MGIYCLSLQMLVRARTWGSIACLYKCWLELGHGGLLPVFTNGVQISDMGVYCPVFTNGDQSSDTGVYCLSLQMLVRARTWGSIVCLYKCWLELGHRGLLPVFTNAG